MREVHHEADQADYLKQIKTASVGCMVKLVPFNQVSTDWPEGLPSAVS
jgi:hypothetical protein